MLTVNRGGIILHKSEKSFESHGVLNPAVIEENGIIHLLYRAVDQELISSIGHCQLDNPLHVFRRKKTAFLKPINSSESMGLEDPRIVKIHNLYYLSYTSYDGKNAMGALMTGKELSKLKRHGIIVPKIPLFGAPHTLSNVQKDSKSNFEQKSSSYFIWDKNLVFFPRRIDGELCFFHRIKPRITLVRINELTDLNPSFWDKQLAYESRHFLTCPSMMNGGASYFGAGCPPIETPEGWLFIYHAAYEVNNKTIYKIHIILLDLVNPLIVLAELPYPILEPETTYEKFGNVANVVFPTGAILRDDNLFMYYGAADQCIACAYFSVTELFKEFNHLTN